MRKKLVLIGAGAHSDAIVPLINFSEYELVGFIDDKDITNRIGYPIIGKISDINNLAEKYIFDSLLFSIGDNDKRIEVYNEIKIKDKLINIISPDAKIITPTSIIGKGIFIGADAPVFDNSIINTNAVVEHHSIIREHCNVGPSATINENVVLNEGVYVGSGAIIIQYITVVKNVILGVGAVVAMKLVHMLVCLLKESSKEVYE